MILRLLNLAFDREFAQLIEETTLSSVLKEVFATAIKKDCRIVLLLLSATHWICWTLVDHLAAVCFL